VCELTPYELIITTGDTHIYTNHIEQAKLQITRDPLLPPFVKLNETIKSILDFRPEHIQLLDYKYWPHIKMQVAV
jgi:thymidylate synthase